MLEAVLKNYRGGIIRSFPRAFVSIVAAATTATLYQLSTGSKRAILISVMITRRSGGNTFLQIGEGDFTARLPDIPVISTQSETLTIDDGLPIFIFEADITMQAVAAAAAPDNIRVLGTVYEF